MDRISSIELAMKNEKTEMNFYLNEAGRSKNPLAKAMFALLAKDEEEHMTRVAGLHKSLMVDGEWPEDVPIEVAGTDIRETLDSLVSKKGSSEDHDDDDIKALEKAIEFEGRGEKFYMDLSQAAPNRAEKDFFSFLSGIEREHRLSLADSLNYLKNPETWMEEHEKSGLDGA